MRAPRTLRWNLWLPLAAGGVALALMLLALTAESAFRDRHGLALEGRYLRLAHRLEAQLREAGPGEAAGVLEQALASDPDYVEGLALLDGAGEVEAEAGSGSASETHLIDLYLGRQWAQAAPYPGAGTGPGFGMRGKRTLSVAETARARRRPPAELLLLPTAAFTGLVVVGLAWLGGRLLTRQQEEARREATRRRLEGLGRAGAGLAHQLRTPLATIKGSCQLLLEDASPAAARRLEAAVGESRRMEQLLGQLLDYARPPAPEMASVALGPLFGQLGPAVEVGAGSELRVAADEVHLRQILANLVENALAASPAEARVAVAARRRGPRIEIAVSDRGSGPGGDPEALFEPYVSRRADGTGLGLPIARALAEAGGGELTLEGRAGGGTRAVLTLPRAEEAA